MVIGQQVASGWSFWTDGIDSRDFCPKRPFLSKRFGRLKINSDKDLDRYDQYIYISLSISLKVPVLSLSGVFDQNWSHFT